MISTIKKPAIMPKVKGLFPFRLGTTSYVYPDHILPNIKLLKDQVDDIQLILFEGEEGDIPTKYEMQEIRKIGEDSSLDFIVHFPIDYRLGDPDSGKRRIALEQHCRIADQTSEIAHAFVVHAEAPYYNNEILTCLDTAFAELRKHVPASIPLCLENLDYDFSITEPIRQKYNLLVCVDTGHLSLYGMNTESHWANYKNVTPVVHLHGCNNGKDHLALSQNPAGVNKFWKKQLMNFRGTVILELFSFQETLESLEYLKSWITG